MFKFQSGMILLLSAVAMVSHAETRPRDHRVNLKDAISEVAIFKEWMIGVNRSGVVDAVVSPLSPIGSRYNLKGLDNKRFLQYERQGKLRGINLGWSNNATTKTARNKSNWILVPKNLLKQARQKDRREAVRSRPIRYGETIALGWQGIRRPSRNNVWAISRTWSFLKYSKRNVGINLKWVRDPSYEWTILGGKPGDLVRLGKDRVVLYNLKHKQPMIHYNRQIGGHIGWPDTKSPGFTKVGKNKKIKPEIWNALIMKNQ